MKSGSKELAIGALVLVALVVLAIMILYFGETGSLFADTYKVSAHFVNAAGMRRGVPVRMAGVDIGSVDSIRLVPTKLARQEGRPSAYVEVCLAIEKIHLIPDDSQLSLSPSLMLGEQYLEFSVGISEVDLPADGTARIDGVVMLSPNKLMESFSVELTNTTRELTKTLNDVQDVIGTPEAKKQIREIMSNATTVSQRAVTAATELEEALGKAKVFTDHLDQLAINIDDQLAMQGENLSKATVYLEKNAKRLETILTSLDEVVSEGKGSAGKLLTSDELHDETVKTLRAFRELATDLGDSLGDISTAAQSFGSLSDQIRDNPSQLVWGRKRSRKRSQPAGEQAQRPAKSGRNVLDRMR